MSATLADGHGPTTTTCSSAARRGAGSEVGRRGERLGRAGYDCPARDRRRPSGRGNCIAGNREHHQHHERPDELVHLLDVVGPILIDHIHDDVGAESGRRVVLARCRDIERRELMDNALLWYVARASGVVAWGLVSASVVWGLALSSRAFGRRPRPAWLLDLHRFLGGLALVFTGVHVLAILTDTYVHFGLVEVLVPLASSWHPLAVAFGIVGFYLLAAVEVTSLLRDRVPRQLWRRVHFASFPLFVVTTVHLLSAGTDTGNPVLTMAVIVMVASVGALTTYRFLPEDGAPGRRPVSAR